MTNSELVRAVEYANDLKRLVNENFADVADIDFLIKELKNKKAIIQRRLNSNCDRIKCLLNNVEFADGTTDIFIDDLRSTVEGVTNYINANM